MSNAAATAALADGATAHPSARAGGSPAARRRRRIGLLLAAPGLAVYAVVVLWPLVQSIQYSFYSWNGTSASSTWVGLRNYLNFFTDPVLSATLGHVLVLLIFFSAIPIALGLLAAAVITRSRSRGGAVFRWIYFLPQVLTSVVIALVFKRMYAPEGPVNETLRALGLDALTRNWLGDFTWALPALGLIGTWITFGFCMVLFISGVSAISPELYEAARVDGAGPVREFFSVTVPGLRGQLAVAITLTVTAALRTFDLVWITTRGGPGTATQTPAIALYKAAFVNPDVGQAAAIGVVMAVLCLVIAVVVTRISERE
ncbi:carbohydrate ABC transporter membrane protein 1 (CUT1 family) [Salana multivorans]|uniref:Carbohydrate ABC transporter membrane protein 1 (CUT1 family) n=1 Tax=Salana multivorans TaxID=120377 RepID=A0A3N2DBP3_9MICO|nr:sugar ABC transporter permease [Salana multivorans]MBN8881749.1 sugar ABC transporter permease [Salana multivorans]ROR97157.1 carbohydrate ABC transporter membrane protein 1 (CUT1 family) [Salana multivorans]